MLCIILVKLKKITESIQPQTKKKRIQCNCSFVNYFKLSQNYKKYEIL